MIKIFKNIFYNTRQSTIHLWEQYKGEDMYTEIPWCPYVFLKTPGGNFQTIDGFPVAKKQFSSYNRYWNYCKDKNNTFEDKVKPEIQFLAERYHGIEDDKIEVPKLKIYSLDIETHLGQGFPSIDKADDRVTLISIYDVNRKKAITFGDKVYNGNRKDVLFIYCENEVQLLTKFFKFMNKYPCDVVTGWNIYGFDLPYIINRCKNLFGEETKEYTLLSPIKVVRTWQSQEGNMNVDIAGVAVLDYMDLYKWYATDKLESYSLDFVATHELEKGKLDYSEYKDLKELYDQNWNKYVDYNIIDALRVVQLEEKCGYIRLVQALSLLTKCPMKYYHTMTQLIEGCLLTYYRRNGLVAPHFYGGTQESYPAAYVKEPQKGKHSWIVDLDITSSYPTAIITLNMSNETYFGRIQGLTEDLIMDYTKKREFPPFEIFKEIGPVKMSGRKLDHFNHALKKRLLCIAPCGSVFSTKEPGTIATVQRAIFKKRKEVKNHMIKLKKSLPVLRDETLKNAKEKVNQLFDFQYALKILLNATYGIMAVPYSRYFNPNIAEAITSCGRQTIKAGERYVNQFLQQEWVKNQDFVNLIGEISEDPFFENPPKNDEDHVAYIDTDSVFIRLGDFLKYVVGEAWEKLDDKKKIGFIMRISAIIEDYVNDRVYRNVQRMAYNSAIEDFRITFKQEIVAKSALFVKKKKYCYWCVNDEGVPCDKVEVTGLDVVRSDSSEAIRVRLKDVLEMIIKDTPEGDLIKKISKYKKELKNVYPEEIAASLGVKNLKKYIINGKIIKGTPWHVKGVANYRFLLKELDIENNYENIFNGMKTKVVYVKRNPYNITTVTFLRWPKEFDSLLQIDYDIMIEKFFVKKIRLLLEPMNKVNLLDETTKIAIETFFGSIKQDVEKVLEGEKNG